MHLKRTCITMLTALEPPEVLRAVLDQCEDLAAKMWPDDPDDPPREVEQAAQVDMHSVPGL